jgi:hypothetical protein
VITLLTMLIVVGISALGALLAWPCVVSRRALEKRLIDVHVLGTTTRPENCVTPMLPSGHEGIAAHAFSCMTGPPVLLALSTMIGQLFSYPRAAVDDTHPSLLAASSPKRTRRHRLSIRTRRDACPPPRIFPFASGGLRGPCVALPRIRSEWRNRVRSPLGQRVLQQPIARVVPVQSAGGMASWRIACRGLPA